MAGEIQIMIPQYGELNPVQVRAHTYLRYF